MAPELYLNKCGTTAERAVSVCHSAGAGLINHTVNCGEIAWNVKVGSEWKDRDHSMKNALDEGQKAISLA